MTYEKEKSVLRTAARREGGRAMSERAIAFVKGDYTYDLENATVVVHVPRDVYADEIEASAALLARSREASEERGEDAA